MIPVFKPLIEQEEIKASTESLELGWLGMGSYVSAFEEKVKEIIDVEDRYVAAVSTGTAGLHIALLVAGVQPGECCVDVFGKTRQRGKTVPVAAPVTTGIRQQHCVACCMGSLGRRSQVAAVASPAMHHQQHRRTRVPGRPPQRCQLAPVDSGDADRPCLRPAGFMPAAGGPQCPQQRQMAAQQQECASGQKQQAVCHVSPVSQTTKIYHFVY